MRVIFIHVARTGGTSIKKLFNGKDDITFFKLPKKHLSVRDIRKRLGEKNIDQFIDKYFFVAFIRNPFTRFQSYFHHARKMGHRGEEVKNKDIKEAFRWWMKNYESNPSTLDALKTQYDYLEIEGQLCTNFLGRYESFATDVERLKNILDITRKISINNASDSEYDGGLWDQEHIDFILKEYEKDFHIFGYPETPWL